MKLSLSISDQTPLPDWTSTSFQFKAEVEVAICVPTDICFANSKSSY